MKKYNIAEKLEKIKEVESLKSKLGMSVKSACKKVEISDVSFYVWKKQNLDKKAGEPTLIDDEWDQPRPPLLLNRLDHEVLHPLK